MIKKWALLIQAIKYWLLPEWQYVPLEVNWLINREIYDERALLIMDST